MYELLSDYRYVKCVCTARQAAARHQASQQQGAKNQYGPLTTAGPGRLSFSVAQLLAQTFVVAAVVIAL
jgi:hypothetical protein